MFQQNQSSIKPWVQKTLRVSCIILGLVLVLCSASLLASASPSCPGASVYPITCKCDNGQIERHFDHTSFMKARDNPNSCCYYKPNAPVYSEFKVYNQRDLPKPPVASPNAPKTDNLYSVVIDTQEEEKPELYKIQPVLVRVPMERIEIELESPNLIVIKALFRSVFQLHPLFASQTSNPLAF